MKHVIMALVLLSFASCSKDEDICCPNCNHQCDPGPQPADNCTGWIARDGQPENCTEDDTLFVVIFRSDYANMYPVFTGCTGTPQISVGGDAVYAFYANSPEETPLNFASNVTHAFVATSCEYIVLKRVWSFAEEEEEEEGWNYFYTPNQY